MKKPILILEVGGEGGSIKLIQNGSVFFYTTSEIAMMDFLPDEFNSENLRSSSPVYATFDQSMESLIKKYPVFSLYPLQVHPDYINRIKVYFLRYMDEHADREIFGVSSWKDMLQLE